MALPVFRIKIPNANLVAAGTNTQWINRDGTLTLQASAPPKDVWDLSMYDAWSLTIACGSPGLTGASGGNIGYNRANPGQSDAQVVSGMPFYDTSGGVNLISFGGGAAFTSMTTVQQIVPGGGRHNGLIFYFSSATTPVTAGADLYIYLYGFRGAY